jgi:hypothetical protein
MKIKFAFAALLLLALAACTNRSTTTGAVSDSTAVAQEDTTPVVIDSPAVVELPPVDSGSAPTPDATPPSAEGSKTTPANGKVAGGGDPDPLVQTYRITVSFISKGGGIDYKALASWDKFVAGFEVKNKVTLAHETVNWGREGEVDYCYKLAELKEPKLSEFVNQCKAQVKDNALILLKENANCRVKRK